MKKKPQRYSYKKLITTSKRLEPKVNEQIKLINERDRNNPSYAVRSSSKNKSAQKILSVYESSNTRFKIGKFLNGTSNQRSQRIRTQTDEFQKTKSHYNKLNCFRKIENKCSHDKFEPNSTSTNKNNRMNYNSSKPIYSSNKPVDSLSKPLSNNRMQLNPDQKIKNIHHHENTITKQRGFNKRLNLNSQLFQNFNKNSLEKGQAPQTSKNQKKNFSFRKAHDSHRSGNKKTALQKYISQSLQNLQFPIKKKNSKILRKGQQPLKQVQYPLKQVQKSLKQVIKQVKDFKKQKQKTFFQYQTKQLTTQNEKLSSRQQKINSHRRLNTQKDDSIQKIQIKWQRKKKNPYDLSNQEAQTFGDRFPDGFDKVKLLGRGGFSLVWLGQHKKSKKKYAVKQIITQSSHQTHIKEIWFGTYFFQFGGAPKQQFVDCPGIKNLVKLYYYFINKKDTWILYEKCGDSLGNTLYELKGQTYNHEKVYRIHYKQFYTRLRNDQSMIRKIILQVSKALLLLAQNNIVHSDLKTQNILIKLKQPLDECKTTKLSGRKSQVIQQVKLIDYGSSFVFSNLRQFSMATPQYMAPQILNFILYQNQLQYIPKLFDYVQEYHDPWVIDVWSLGSVILQIISGIPLWMSLKTIVKQRNKELVRYGLFAVKGRTFDKIIKKQLQVVQNLDRYLQEQNYSEILIQQDLKYLLKRMLSLNPAKRISPSQIIDFLTQEDQEKD